MQLQRHRYTRALSQSICECGQMQWWSNSTQIISCAALQKMRIQHLKWFEEQCLQVHIEIQFVWGHAISPLCQMGRLYKEIIISNWLLLVIGYWTILQLHNHVEGLDTNLTHHVSFPLSNPVTSGLKGVLNIQNTYRASRGKGIGLMHLCYVANSVSSSMFTFPSLKRAMSIYANIFTFWALMPVYIIFSKSWHDDNDNDGHLVTTLSL